MTPTERLDRAIKLNARLIELSRALRTVQREAISELQDAKADIEERSRQLDSIAPEPARAQ